MILIFDLDRTLIDTEKFIEAVSEIFGISVQEIKSHINFIF